MTTESVKELDRASILLGVLKEESSSSEEDDFAFLESGTCSKYRAPNQNCQFYEKVGACKYGKRCTKPHKPLPECTTVVLHNLYHHQQLAVSKDGNEGQGYEDVEMVIDFENFYNDIIGLFLAIGSVTNFKCCQNFVSHLRGNVYVQYTTHSSAKKAVKLFNRKMYNGRYIMAELCPIKDWNLAICNLFFEFLCPRGNECNYMHVFENPGNAYPYVPKADGLNIKKGLELECKFFLKTGTCKYGKQCVKSHVVQLQSPTTIMIQNMFADSRLALPNDSDYDEVKLIQTYEQFYELVIEGFRALGTVTNFKCCQNHILHLRGNVYVEYSSHAGALKAQKAFDKTFYQGRLLEVVMTPITNWKSSICGLWDKRLCARGKNCNFMHVFRNPRSEFSVPNRTDFDPERAQRSGFDLDFIHLNHPVLQYYMKRDGASANNRKATFTAKNVTQGNKSCIVFFRTGTCRYASRCSFSHDVPHDSPTVLIKKFFRRSQDPQDDDMTDHIRKIKDFESFYDDVIGEFKTVGDIVMFKCCVNEQDHMFGNVYIQYVSHSEAVVAMNHFNGRWYDGRELSVEPCSVTNWEKAICGMYDKQLCPRKHSCNYLHVLRNPRNEYTVVNRTNFDPAFATTAGGYDAKCVDVHHPVFLYYADRDIGDSHGTEVTSLKESGWDVEEKSEATENARTFLEALKDSKSVRESERSEFKRNEVERRRVERQSRHRERSREKQRKMRAERRYKSHKKHRRHSHDYKRRSKRRRRDTLEVSDESLSSRSDEGNDLHKESLGNQANGRQSKHENVSGSTNHLQFPTLASWSKMIQPFNASQPSEDQTLPQLEEVHPIPTVDTAQAERIPQLIQCGGVNEPPLDYQSAIVQPPTVPTVPPILPLQPYVMANSLGFNNLLLPTPQLNAYSVVREASPDDLTKYASEVVSKELIRSTTDKPSEDLTDLASAILSKELIRSTSALDLAKYATQILKNQFINSLEKKTHTTSPRQCVDVSPRNESISRDNDIQSPSSIYEKKEGSRVGQDNIYSLDSDEFLEENGSSRRENDRYPRERSGHSRENDRYPRERSGHSRESDMYLRERSGHSRESDRYPRERSGHSRENDRYPRERSGHLLESDRYPRKRSGHSSESDRYSREHSGRPRESNRYPLERSEYSLDNERFSGLYPKERAGHSGEQRHSLKHDKKPWESYRYMSERSRYSQGGERCSLSKYDWDYENGSFSENIENVYEGDLREKFDGRNKRETGIRYREDDVSDLREDVTRLRNTNRYVSDSDNIDRLEVSNVRDLRESLRQKVSEKRQSYTNRSPMNMSSGRGELAYDYMEDRSEYWDRRHTGESHRGNESSSQRREVDLYRSRNDRSVFDGYDDRGRYNHDSSFSRDFRDYHYDDVSRRGDLERY